MFCSFSTCCDSAKRCDTSSSRSTAASFATNSEYSSPLSSIDPLMISSPCGQRRLLRARHPNPLLRCPSPCHTRQGREHFFFHHTASSEIYTLSLHDALPI